MTDQKTVIDLYKKSGSIRAVSRETGYSEPKVRKILITGGAITPDTLPINSKVANAFKPYTRGPYQSKEVK